MVGFWSRLCAYHEKNQIRCKKRVIVSTLVVIAFSKISLTMLLDLKSSILYVFYHRRKTIIMSNYIEYQDKVAFHPGYYVKEIIEKTGVI